MLKIKDNVDLKELEKFGFKKQPKPYLRILFMHSKRNKNYNDITK